MGRKAREESSVGLYHVITRGNNKTQLFHCREDFNQFLKIVGYYLEKQPVKIHHYCLMTNHAHLLVWAGGLKALGQFMHGIQRSYHHHYRKNYTWFGHLFQGRFKSLPIENEAYLLDCGRYIERNPVRAKMVDDPKDWNYSSYQVYAYGKKNDLVTQSVAYESLANNDCDRQELYQNYVETTRPYEEIIDKELIGT